MENGFDIAFSLNKKMDDSYGVFKAYQV